VVMLDLLSKYPSGGGSGSDAAAAAGKVRSPPKGENDLLQGGGGGGGGVLSPDTVLTESIHRVLQIFEVLHLSSLHTPSIPSRRRGTHRNSFVIALACKTMGHLKMGMDSVCYSLLIPLVLKFNQSLELSNDFQTHSHASDSDTTSMTSSTFDQPTNDGGDVLSSFASFVEEVVSNNPAFFDPQAATEDAEVTLTPHPSPLSPLSPLTPHPKAGTTVACASFKY
jgi:hypothetical protein